MMTAARFSIRNILLAVLAAILGGNAAMAETEQPKFTVLAQDKDFELRSYAPMIVAEVSVGGTRDEAVNAGFRILAGYIFGGNEPQAKIAMTAPVTQQKGEAIAMTAPVTQQARGGDWLVRFTMPASFTMATLPKPTDARIRLVAVPGRKVAALRFSGFRTDEALAAQADRLATILSARGLKPAGPPTFAYYDPPWTLPFLRRNEVLRDIR
jgi:hypothetical protein